MLTARKIKAHYMDGIFAVNIPQDLGFNSEELYVNKIGDVLMVTPVSRLAETLERGAAILAMLPEEFMEGGMPENIPAVREEL